MKKELDFLGDAVDNPERPFVAIIGGAKVSGKIDVIEALLPKVDTLVVGGGMAYTFYKAQGKEIGGSLVEDDRVAMAKALLAKAARQAGAARRHRRDGRFRLRRADGRHAQDRRVGRHRPEGYRRRHRRGDAREVRRRS